MAAQEHAEENVTEEKPRVAGKLMYSVNIPSSDGSWYTNSETNIYFNRRMIYDLHDAIAKEVSADAAVQYTNMVAGLYIAEQNLRPPRFLDSVHALEGAGWIYQGPHVKGKTYDGAINQFADMMAAANTDDEEVVKARDEKALFLWKYGHELTEPYRTLFRQYIEKNNKYMPDYLK